MTRHELNARIKELQQLRDECLNWQHGDDDEKEIMAEYAIRVIVELNRVKRQLKFISMPSIRGEITPDMVEHAKAYPVNRLVMFTKGRAKAWCHDDRNPSMYHGTRKNVACCPVCGKTFNPISILMERDGMTFPDAVRNLQ